MTREEFQRWIQENYEMECNCPWEKYPSHEVYRHAGNQKWFALFMTISRDKLGMQGTDSIAIVNLKCDPLLQGSFLQMQGIFPAYHMNKKHWISVILDGSVPKETMQILLDNSYVSTRENKKGNR